jgi:aromatic-L-amino-acid decarboxylase
MNKEADVDFDDEPADLAGLVTAMERILPDLAGAADPKPRAGWFPAFDDRHLRAAPRPEHGAGIDAVVDELRGFIADGCAITSSGFVGYITTGVTTSSAVAQAAVAVAGGQRYLHHAFNSLESTALRWLADLCGIPTAATGVFTSGGSTANLVALGAARQAAYERIGIDVAENGSRSAPPGRIYVSTRGHRTIHRSAAVLGVGRANVIDIPCDRAGHIDLAVLASTMDADRAAGVLPIAVVAVAGSTDTGSVDDTSAIVELAKARDCWVHVDGAYGLVARASERLAPLFDGVEDADSWIVDPHKWLATNVGVGAVYVRDGSILERVYTQGHAEYIEGGFRDEDVVSQWDSLAGRWADQALELSAPPRGTLVWAVLRELGREGVARRVDRHVGLARYLADRVQDDPRLELLCEPDLSTVCFRYVPPEGDDANDVNVQILEALRRTTTTVPSSTVIEGQFALRPNFINPRVRRADADQLLANCVAIGDRLCRREAT